MRKGNLEEALAIKKMKEAVQGDIDVPEVAGWEPAKTKKPKGILLVDFGKSENLNRFGIRAWNKILKSGQVSYSDSGPDGLVKTGKGPRNPDFHGVTGDERNFRTGDQITVTWYNLTDAEINFTPKLSLTDANGAERGSTGWKPMSAGKIAPGKTGETLFTVDDSTAGAFTLVNINPNIPGPNALLCDKIIFKSAK